MSVRIAVRAIIFQNGKLFSVKLTDYNKKGEKNKYWCVPGGGLDPLESLEDALVREMIEETGVRPVVGRLLYIQQFGDSHQEHLEFFFNIENTLDYNNVDISNTSHGMEEIDQFDFIEPSSSFIKPLFLSDTDIGADIAEDKPVKIYNYIKL